MTPQDYQSLHDEIINRQDLSQYVVTNNMPKENAYPKDKIIADALNLNQNVQGEVRLNIASFLSRAGALTGSTIIQKLEAIAVSEKAINLALIALESPIGLNFGDPELWIIVDLITDDLDPTKLTTAQGTLIKNLGKIPRSVTPEQVSIALRGNSEFTPI